MEDLEQVYDTVIVGARARGEDEETISDGLYLSELVSKIHFIPGTLTPHYSSQRLEKLLRACANS